MFNILKFLKRYNPILLFVILEVLSIIMIVNSQPYHKRKMVNVSNEMSGKLFELTSQCNAYFHLKEENDRLSANNAMLMNMLSAANMANDSVTTVLGNGMQLSDSLSRNSFYCFIPAHVIDNDIYNIHNYILLDKGSKDGIEIDMGVISDHGIVGTVSNVSRNYSSVISVLNPYTVVSAMFKDNKHLANVKWDNMDYRFGVVEDIPSHLVINKGDTLLTSGFSGSYPPDVMIGEVENILPSDNEDFTRARIRFFTNFSTLRNVYIVKNNFKQELDSLKIH